MTAQLSCHVQNFVAITVLESRWQWNKIEILNLNCDGKNIRETGPAMASSAVSKSNPTPSILFHRFSSSIKNFAKSVLIYISNSTSLNTSNCCTCIDNSAVDICAKVYVDTCISLVFEITQRTTFWNLWNHYETGPILWRICGLIQYKDVV